MKQGAWLCMCAVKPAIAQKSTAPCWHAPASELVGRQSIPLDRLVQRGLPAVRPRCHPSSQAAKEMVGMEPKK